MKPSFGHLAGTDLWEKQWEDNEEIALHTVLLIL